MNALVATLLTLVLTSPVFADGPPSYWSEELSDIQAVAGTPTGAAATARAGEKQTSAIRYRLSPAPEYQGVVIKGQVRSLIFIEEGAALLAVVQKQKKKQAWDTFLLKIDTSTSKTSRLVTLPQSAAGMAVWPGAKHLLVACDQEIRSFTLPGFRSGPLYQLPGGNLALAHHSGPLVLVGRTRDLVLVNLEDPQGEEQIPTRQQFGISSPLRSMTISPDATTLYGVTLDGEKVEQPLDVLDVSAAVLPRVPSTPEPLPEPAPLPEPLPEPAPVVVEDPAAEPEPIPEVEPEPEPLPEPAPVVAEDPGSEPEPAPAQETPGRGADFHVYGSLAGAVADRVEWVLLLGPDNILREAARVRPGTDGHWGVASLPSGRYRVVLDGGGGHVLVSEPRFATIQVIEGETTKAPSFDVQRVR